MVDRFVIDYPSVIYCDYCSEELEEGHVLCGCHEQRYHPSCFIRHVKPKEKIIPHCYSCLDYLTDEEVAKTFKCDELGDENWCRKCWEERENKFKA